MPVLNPTIQLVIVYLYTKYMYEHFILNGSRDIFDENVSRKDGRTDRRTEGRTDVNQYTPPLFQSGGIKTETEADTAYLVPLLKTQITLGP